MDEDEGAFWEQEIGRRFPSQSLSGADVEPPGDVVELILREQREVGSFGQILAKQSVGVLVDVPKWLAASSRT